MTNKEIRDKAMREVMWQVGSTCNAVTQYISDAVAKQIVTDECGSAGWIPVDEQLPEPHVDVLISFIDFGEEASTFIDCLVDNNGRLTWSTYNGATDKVLAWMPLPEPYQLGRCDKRCKIDVTSCNKWDTNKCELHELN